MFTAPSEWYKLSPDADMELGAGPWLHDSAACCKHCVWNLGYPLIDPIVIATDRTNTNASQHLDCTKFEREFDALDIDLNGQLTMAEMDPYLEYGVNKYLVDAGRLSKPSVFEQADLNLDEQVSKEEWYVLRHFWAPVHLAGAGPLPTSEAIAMKDGPLGGLFWDANLIELFMVSVVNILLEQVVASKCWGCGCCGADICPEDCPWQSGYVREFTSREQNSVLRKIDLDGSQRVSLEEHYFHSFADRNGDGVVDLDEYYHSLYPMVDEQGRPDSSRNRVQFTKHDLNGDGNITFLERKFIRADHSTASNQGREGELSKAEWVKADLPEYFGPFDGHIDKSVGTVTGTTYTYYSALHECALEGVRAYQVAFSSHPWAPRCTIEAYVSSQDPLDPWIHPITDGTQWRMLAGESGPGSGRHRNDASGSQSSFMLSMWQEVALRLKWTTTIHTAQTTLAAAAALTPPNTAERTFSVGLFAEYPEEPLDGALTCTRSFAPSLDGFVVVVLSDPDEVSLTTAVLIMVYSHSFVNFSCFLFVALIGVGHVYWFIERKENSEQFNPSYAKGVMDAAWFCIVTMSTVGYGDKAPSTGIGKGLTVFWMLFGIICFGIFTGEISAQVNLLSAEASIASFETLSGFDAGVLEHTAHLKLDVAYQFNPKWCKTLDECFDILDSKRAPALVLPQVDVLTYFRTRQLARNNCGNPFRIVGTPVLAGEQYSAKLCSYHKAVFAGQYLIDGVNEMLDTLDKEGFTEMLIEELKSEVEDTSSAESCDPPLGYNLSLVIPCAVIIVLYWIIIYYINHRKRVASGKLLRAMFSTSNKTPEQIALYFGLKWRETARRFKEIRAAGGQVPRPPPTQAVNQDDRLLNYLKRVRLIASGQTQDLQRCQRDVDSVSSVTNIANNFMFAACVVLLGLTAAVIYSLNEVVHAKDRFLELTQE